MIPWWTVPLAFIGGIIFVIILQLLWWRVVYDDVWF